MSNDQTFIRDEKGTIRGGTLSSERARALARLSVEKRNTGRTERAAKLLSELGGLEWEAADESLKTLAVQAVEGGAGSVTAHRLLLTRLGKLEEAKKGTAVEEWDPESGEPCPTCGGTRIALHIDGPGSKRLDDLLADPEEEPLDFEEKDDETTAQLGE